MDNDINYVYETLSTAGCGTLLLNDGEFFSGLYVKQLEALDLLRADTFLFDIEENINARADENLFPAVDMRIKELRNDYYHKTNNSLSYISVLPENAKTPHSVHMHLSCGIPEVVSETDIYFDKLGNILHSIVKVPHGRYFLSMPESKRITNFNIFLYLKVDYREK